MTRSCCFCLSVLLVTALAHAQSNPVPFLYQPPVPASTAPGGPGITLTVNGTGFASASVVKWNGTALQTNFVSGSQLTAAVPADNIVTPSTVTITVTSPSPGGGTSNAEFFSISQPTTPSFTNYGVTAASPLALGVLTSPAVVDVNGDGKLDVVATFETGAGQTTEFAVLLGRGDGSFQPPVVTNLGGNQSIQNQNTSVGDFNGDGKIDVAIGQNGGSAVAVALGNGDGTFGSQTNLAVPTSYEVNFTAVGDFNKDGKLDLIAGSDLIYLPVVAGDNPETMFSVFLGNGDGSFQKPVNYQIDGYLDSMAVGDLNGDGNLDFIAYINGSGLGAGPLLFPGNGDGTFATPVTIGSVSATLLLVADVNGDGKPDILGGGDGTLYVALNNGAGTFLPAVSYSSPLGGASSMSAGDFNADGRLDVAFVPGGNNPGNMAILYGNGDGTFKPAITYPAPAGLGSAAGDFNGDGRLDLYIAPYDVDLLGTVLLQGSFPLLSAAPVSLTFAQQSIDTTSTAQSVVLSNSGKAALTISNIGLAGTNAGDYAETGNCGTTLAINATCQISVTFTPTGQGTRNAMLSIGDNAPGSPQPVGLTGVTTPAAALTLSPSSIVFPGQFVGTTGLPQTITATNTGDATLTITSVASSSKDFGVLNACGDTLAAGSSCSIGVFFDPGSSGSNGGTVTIADNAGGSPQTVALSGMGQDFSFAASSSTATITPGQTANYVVAVNPIAGFNQTVALSCAGAPTGSTCSLSPNSVTLAGSSPISVTVSVTTLGNSVRRSLANDTPRSSGRKAIYLSLCGFPGLIFVCACRRRSRTWKPGGLCGLAFLVVLCLGTTSCGGGGSSGGGGGGTRGTPANTYSLTVTGTFVSGSANLSHSTNLSLVVQ